MISILISLITTAFASSSSLLALPLPPQLGSQQKTRNVIIASSAHHFTSTLSIEPTMFKQCSVKPSAQHLQRLLTQSVKHSPRLLPPPHFSKPMQLHCSLLKPLLPFADPHIISRAQRPEEDQDVEEDQPIRSDFHHKPRRTPDIR